MICSATLHKEKSKLEIAAMLLDPTVWKSAQTSDRSLFIRWPASRNHERSKDWRGVGGCCSVVGVESLKLDVSLVE